MKRAVLGPIALLGGLLTLANLGTILHKSSRVYLFQQAQCVKYYRHHDPSVLDASFHVEEALCKLPAIQASLSVTDGIDSFLQFLPRKPPLLLATHQEKAPQTTISFLPY